MLPIETRRLRLRPFQESDLETFVGYRSDPEIARYQGWEAPFSLTKGAAFISEMNQKQAGAQGKWYQVAFELKAISQLIGDCAFRVLAEDARQAEIGFTLARQYQRKGYATEGVARVLDYLFNELGLHRVVAFCDVDNQASARLMERVGMRQEGRFIESIWCKGEWRSEFAYAVLQGEWKQHKAILSA